MMIDRDDEQVAEWLRDAAQSYHAPRRTPREEMWARIHAARAARRRIVLGAWARWGIGVAAVLALGIGIGRWSMTERADRAAAATVATGAADDDLPYRIAATQYLSRTEVLLTEFRAGARRGTVDSAFVATAADLLTTTRLMLDSPAAENARFRSLLEDLELVLVQIAQLSARRRAEEVDLIRQGLEQQDVLVRLRTAIPAGPAPAHAEGGL